MSGKLPSAGIIHKGALTKHGYNLKEGDEKRHKALEKAVHEDGYAETQRRLTALEVVDKNHPEIEFQVRADKEWLRRHAFERVPEKDNAGGIAFENKKGDIYRDQIPEWGFRVWKA